MSSVIVGIFDSQATANDAKNKLLLEGFANETVVLSGEDIDTMRTDTIVGETHVEPRQEEGAISRFFSSIFGDGDDERTDQYGNTYREAIRRGHYGVSVNVHGEDDIGRAEAILTQCGAIDIDERSEQWRGEGWVAGGDMADTTTLPAATGLGTGMGTGMAATAVGGMAGEAAGTLKEISEQLKVGKRSVARGGVRVFSRMVETPVEETVRLREEHVDVQRRAVDRPATEADFAAFKEGSVDVREMSEEAVVSKEARVVGEVDVGKTVTERDETVRDTVRETHVEVEQLDPQQGVVHPDGTKATLLPPDNDPLLPR